MTAQTVEVASALECGRCGMTTDLCLSMKDECCVGCTHYPEPVDNDADEVAIARAVAGDTSVPLNRAEYAAAHSQLEAEGKSASQIAAVLGTTERRIQRLRSGATALPYSRPGGRTMSTTEELLTNAARHTSPRVQAAARRAQDAIQRVHDLLAEDAGRAEARERVERLERELREAKAALRGGQAKTAKPSAPREWSGVLLCRKGCGKTSLNGQGRAAHERHCTAGAA